MKAIWKYEITGVLVKVQMPRGAKLLALQVQDEKPMLWAEVDTEAPLEEMTFRTFGTGWEVYKDCEYVGTWQDSSRGFVWHVYKEVKVK